VAAVDDFGIRREIVQLKSLPEPDQLDFELPEGHCCLISDDGTDLTVEVLRQFAQHAWPVVVLRFPQDVIARHRPLPEGTRVLQLDNLNEAHLETCLTEAARLYGPTAVFVHLQPACSECQGEGLTFTLSGRQVLQSVFMTAKYLKETLNKAAGGGRAAFMTVVRLDGEFGLGQHGDFDPTSGGLFGLVKSLNLEWEAVFCRALDLEPNLDPVQAASLIFAELRDPNRRIVEVGYSENGRATLTLEPQSA
jgi:hypothetical protein